MKFLKTSFLLSSLFLGSSSGFCVVIPDGAKDEDYVEAAKAYSAPCRIIRVSEEAEGETASKKVLENYSGALIQHNGHSVILTTGHTFSPDKKGQLYAVFGEEQHEIVHFVVNPAYAYYESCKKKSQKLKPDDKKKTKTDNEGLSHLVSTRVDFSLGFLRNSPKDIEPLCLGVYDVDTLKKITPVSLVGFGKNGSFDRKGNLSYGEDDGVKRLCHTQIQPHKYEKIPLPVVKIASSVDPTTFLYGVAMFGDSGAPVLDKNGKIIAVATSVAAQRFTFQEALQRQMPKKVEKILQRTSEFLEPGWPRFLFSFFCKFLAVPKKITSALLRVDEDLSKDPSLASAQKLLRGIWVKDFDLFEAHVTPELQFFSPITKDQKTWIHSEMEKYASFEKEAN